MKKTVLEEKNCPPLGVTMGCPVGIGPEIIVKYFKERGPSALPIVVVGDPDVLARVAAAQEMEGSVQPWLPGEQVRPGTLPVFASSHLPAQELHWGQPTVATGRAMIAAIEQTVALIRQGHLCGICTCPISKIGLKQSGSPFPGHTEMLASLTASTDYRMMMAGSRLKVVLVTIHEPLVRVSALLSSKRIEDCIAMTVRDLQGDFGLTSPRVAVAGLNPHSGENGMFGSEEIDCIAPAIAAYQGPALVSGPWPPDTIFQRALCGEFDAVIAMYHDQGLIPFKMAHFDDGVNVTLGLPIVRTSVDHGTAYDIAGRGLATPTSLAAAVEMAFSIVAHRRQGEL